MKKVCEVCLEQEQLEQVGKESMFYMTHGSCEECYFGVNDMFSLEQVQY